MSASKQAGFTLIEAIISMVIVSIAAIALAGAMGLAFKHSADGLLDSKSQQLAMAYVEEIRGKRFAEVTPLGGVPPCSSIGTPCGALGPDGETRALFDDVDDYHGVADAPPRDSEDQVVPGFNSFAVAVDVFYATAAQVAAWGLDHASDAKVVTVTVTSADGQARRYPIVIGNY
jgi:MSHA pilin protein MshD